MKPQLVLLAGPNGAGKSTFYDHFLSHLSLPFLNADLFAVEANVDSFEAARILDGKRAGMIEDRLGFITETVFSDPGGAKLDMLRAAVEAGYDVHLIYIAVTPEMSAKRIDQRVARGGHDVPREKLIGRFERSLANLKEAITFVPNIDIYDNSGDVPYRLLAHFENGVLVERGTGRMPAWTRGIIPPASAKRRKKS